MYTQEMLESIKKVEATRASRIGFEPRRMTAEEKDALLREFHPDYISRQILRATGKSFKDYLLNRRMEAVCSFLRNSSLPVNEIENKAGFRNETFFYRKFKQIYGCSPAQW